MSKIKTRIRKNDIVQVISGTGSGKIKADSGDDRGKRGKIVSIDRTTGKAIVQGLKIVYKHKKQSKDPQNPGGGRVEQEAPIALANLMLVCPKCSEATRVGVRVDIVDVNDKKKNKRTRICKKCGSDIPAIE